MNAASMLEQLQSVAVNALGADPMFNGTLSANGVPMPIVLERKGDVVTQIETALGSVGICALVMTPAFEFIDELLEPPDLAGWALIAITVFEDVPINLGLTGTGIPAIRLAQEVLAVLHGAVIGLPVGSNVQRVPKFIGAKSPLVMTSEGPPLQYTISFRAYVVLP